MRFAAILEDVQPDPQPAPQASLDKEHISDLWDGTKIYKVNGVYVRDHLDVDFVWGGHGYAYKFIPKNEIWVEATADPNDLQAILAHEIVEWHEMKNHKKGYEEAHNIALNIEQALRQCRVDPPGDQDTDDPDADSTSMDTGS